MPCPRYKTGGIINMKKLFAMMLALVMVCSMTVTAMAAEVGVSADKNAVDAGDTVTITIKMNETLTGNFRNVQGQLTYDTSAWSYVSHTMGGSYSHYMSKNFTNRNYFTFSNTDFTEFGFTEIPQGTIVTVVFKANSDIAESHLTSAFSLNLSVQDLKGQTERFSPSASVTICKEHTWNDGEVTTNPTCTKEGVKTLTCTYSGCGATKTESIPATGIHTYDEGKVTTEATCTKEGVKTYTCDCGATKTESIPATGVHTWDKGKVTTPATCVKEGVKTYTCDCGETKTEVIPVTDEHTWDEGKVTTEATCTKEGEMLYTCTVEGCGETKTEAIEKLDHTVDGDAWEYDDENHWHVCSVCGEKADVEAHSGGTATTTKKAVCEDCGTSYGKLASSTTTGNTNNGNTNNGTTSGTNAGTDAPKTGDNSMLGFGAVMFILSAGVLGGFGVYKKRRRA